ncbi:MAG: aldehyde dehydrogenase family protein [Acidobacteriota bacterium]
MDSPAEAVAVSEGVEFDELIDRLRAGHAAWRALPPQGRAALLRACMDGVMSVAPRWVELGCRAKGLDPESAQAGEEWLAGPMTTIRGFRLMADTLAALGDHEPNTVRAGPDGRSIVGVFPSSLFDRLLYLGIHGEIWLAPGAPPTRASAYRSPRSAQRDGPRVALVLGAGNVASIAPLDVLTTLVVHDVTVLLKLNPVNGYLQPVFEEAFSPLIDAGVLAIVGGGAQVGSRLANHPGVDRVHLTGSRRTYDALMWGGTGEEQVWRKTRGEPLLTKPVTAELGCVTPILVVPGRWSASDLRFQARHVAAMVSHNASFNCVAGKVLVVAGGWSQRESFLGEVQSALGRTPARLAYYPGAEERFAAFRTRYPRAQAVGPAMAGSVPWTVIPEVPPSTGEYALEQEAFCGILAEVTLDAAGPEDFLGAATSFANSCVEGTLSCVLLVDPTTRRRKREAVDRAIRDLRYGSVAVNVWSGVVFAIGTTTWGAYPGHAPADIGSGVGVVHNSFLYDHPEKSVVEGPFRLRPTPVWFADHRTLREVGRRLTAFEHRPSWSKLPALLWAGLRG